MARARTAVGWRASLHSEVMRAVIDERRPIPSAADLEAIARKANIRIPPGADLSAAHRAIRKVVVLAATTAGVRIPKTTAAGKKAKVEGRPPTKNAARLILLRATMGWTPAAADA